MKRTTLFHFHSGALIAKLRKEGDATEREEEEQDQVLRNQASRRERNLSIEFIISGVLLFRLVVNLAVTFQLITPTERFAASFDLAHVMSSVGVRFDVFR